MQKSNNHHPHPRESGENGEQPSLLFRFPAAASHQLIIGTLQFMPQNISWNATSGQRGWQKPTDYTIRNKGPIPPSSALAIHKYKVSTQPLILKKRGIEGPFFPILPAVIEIKDHNKNIFIRDGIGIHFDANIPGSNGCIVLPEPDEFLCFCDLMKILNTQGTILIPLAVLYHEGNPQ